MWIFLYWIYWKDEKVGLRKYRKFEKSKISYPVEKTLVLSIIWSKSKNEDAKLFKEE